MVEIWERAVNINLKQKKFNLIKFDLFTNSYYKEVVDCFIFLNVKITFVHAFDEGLLKSEKGHDLFTLESLPIY